jgi:hypothetical protein
MTRYQTPAFDSVRLLLTLPKNARRHRPRTGPQVDRKKFDTRDEISRGALGGLRDSRVRAGTLRRLLR